MIKDPIFLLGCHKSGTSLLRSLFDGHPDLFVIPIEAHFFQNTLHWVTYRLRRTLPQNHISIEELKDNLIKWINHCNLSSDKFADSITFNKWDISLFHKSIHSYRCINLKELYTAYVRSMYLALFKKEM